ncbi:hypothetical protein BACI349Y_560030 [Bacillus sp. 349Y]|nr:hypothetical protein BACI349Y_560030 [Bacillus sp. 349Y]
MLDLLDMVNVQAHFLLLAFFLDGINEDLALTFTGLTFPVVSLQSFLPEQFPVLASVELLLLRWCFVFFHV